MARGNLALCALKRGDYSQASARVRANLQPLVKLGDRSLLASNLSILAEVAAASGVLRSGVTLLSASATMLDAARLLRPPEDETRYRGVLSRLRERLGDEAFADAWAAGQAMTLEEAVVFALEDTE
jgi:hypothetical protein